MSPLDPWPVFALLVARTVLLTVGAGVLEILPGVHNIVAIVNSVIIQTPWLALYWTPLICLVRESERMELESYSLYLVHSYLMDDIKIIKNINIMKGWTKLETRFAIWDIIIIIICNGMFSEYLYKLQNCKHWEMCGWELQLTYHTRLSQMKSFQFWDMQTVWEVEWQKLNLASAW